MASTSCPILLTRRSNLVQLRIPFSLSLLAVLLSAAMPALAQQSPIDPNWVQQPRLPELPPMSNQPLLPDTLQFRLGQTLEHDSNVFRLPGSLPRQSDTYGVTTLGLKFDKRYGLQRIELDVSAQDYRYQHNTALDFTAVNYVAAWRWGLTPRFTGNVTANRSEYIDNTSLVQSTGVVNHRTEAAKAIDGEYDLGSAVRLLAGVFDRSVNNSVTAVSIANTSVTGGDVGVKYVFNTGNTLAYRYLKGNGEYNGLPTSTLPSRHFSDVEHEFSFEMRPTGSTNLQGRVSHLERKRDDSAGSEFSGVVGRVNANWVITGKSSLDVGVIREISSYQPNALIPSYFVSGRVYISPVWKPTEKTAVRLRFDEGVRDYKGSLEPGYAGRRDNLNQSGVSFEWEPRRNVKLAASLAYDKRSSNIQNLDYKANVLGLSALVKF